ncbi:transposase [Mycolicibacterium novocastrense]|uniref:Transposase n=1 Tax=Mycolicibacterium novocastrense TaxID=59813 RepID=A0ABQ0KTI3_MYCNV|nr:transposase [Mycolicibacterium novocastrense]
MLLLHGSMTASDVTAGIAAALKVGAVSADVVTLEARRHAGTGGASSHGHLAAHSATPEHRVVSLPQRRLTDPAAVIAGLPPDTRPLPNVGAYDELLARRRNPSAEATAPATAPTISEESHVS